MYTPSLSLISLYDMYNYLDGQTISIYKLGLSMVLGAVEIHDDTSLQKSQLWRPETIRETHKGALIE